MFANVTARSFSRQNSNAPLFEALVAETHHAGAMSAIVSSYLNACALRRTPVDRAVVDRYLPHEPGVLLALTRGSLLDVEPLQETRTVLYEFFAALSVLRGALDDYGADAATIGEARAHILHVAPLKFAAGKLCQEALRTVNALQIETSGRLSDLYGDQARALSLVLIEAERGGIPCIDSDGQPVSPDLPQRRYCWRRTLGQNCRIHLRSSISSAFAKDVSEGGIGLLRAPPLRPEDQVVVELENGRQFTGRVAWTRDDAAGVQFDRPLSAADPILAT